MERGQWIGGEWRTVDGEGKKLFVGCLTSQQHANVPLGRISSDNCAYYHTETEVADKTFYLTQSQYTDTGQTSPSADPKTPSAWKSSPWCHRYEETCKKIPGKSGNRTQVRRLTTRPIRRWESIVEGGWREGG